MEPKYQQYLDQAKTNRKGLNKRIKSLKKLRKGDVDNLIHSLHEEAFEDIDCLKCANCCKTTGPLFTTKDIDRISHFLGLKAAEFIQKYLRIDEDHDYVLNTLPCPFLGSDNYCQIYEVRPKACREYPHTDRVNQLGILSKTKKNALICPAVARIIENIKI